MKSWTGNVSVAASPTESQASTFPFGRSATWIPTTGQASTGPHCPTCPGSAASAAVLAADAHADLSRVPLSSRASAAAVCVTVSSA